MSDEYTRVEPEVVENLDAGNISNISTGFFTVEIDTHDGQKISISKGDYEDLVEKQTQAAMEQLQSGQAIEVTDLPFLDMDMLKEKLEDPTLHVRGEAGQVAVALSEDAVKNFDFNADHSDDNRLISEDARDKINDVQEKIAQTRSEIEAVSLHVSFENVINSQDYEGTKEAEIINQIQEKYGNVESVEWDILNMELAAIMEAGGDQAEHANKIFQVVAGSVMADDPKETRDFFTKETTDKLEPLLKEWQDLREEQTSLLQDAVGWDDVESPQASNQSPGLMESFMSAVGLGPAPKVAAVDPIVADQKAADNLDYAAAKSGGLLSFVVGSARDAVSALIPDGISSDGIETMQPSRDQEQTPALTASAMTMG